VIIVMRRSEREAQHHEAIAGASTLETPQSLAGPGPNGSSDVMTESAIGSSRRDLPPDPRPQRQEMAAESASEPWSANMVPEEGSTSARNSGEWLRPPGGRMEAARSRLRVPGTDDRIQGDSCGSPRRAPFS
jgi:hypothetical protein